ncbi:MAG: hemolysin III family protein [Spirochaetes bacterium]|nr:MAG: hemolysin III family protein [Spirochaetota bacterium]
MRKERVSVYTHLAGVALAVAGTVFLAFTTRKSASLLGVSLIYGFSAIFLFSASSLYHAFKREEDEVSFWRKLDHLAIFFMIAGTYTPVCYAYLDGGWRWSIIGVQWALVLAGLFMKLFYLNAPRWLTAGVYVIMGWIAIIPVHRLYGIMPADALLYLALGGAAYTSGAIIYAIERPRLLPGVFSFHELFHVLILLGGFFHFLLVYVAMTGALNAA